MCVIAVAQRHIDLLMVWQLFSSIFHQKLLTNL